MNRIDGGKAPLCYFLIKLWWGSRLPSPPQIFGLIAPLTTYKYLKLPTSKIDFTRNPELSI